MEKKKLRLLIAAMAETCPIGIGTAIFQKLASASLKRVNTGAYELDKTFFNPDSSSSSVRPGFGDLAATLVARRWDC
jgi:hypothetical protein